MKRINHNLYWTIINTSRSNKLLRMGIDMLALVYYKVFRSHLRFTFENKRYPYFYHLYNRTIASERVVEISLAKSMLDKFNSKSILEVGNVLSHYFPVSHAILDKYEKGERVINEDVINFTHSKKFDLIISISTLEHVGYSCGEKLDPHKFLKAIKNLKKYLKPGGTFFVTLPIFYNPHVTKLILKRKTGFSKELYMQRISYLNDWKQTTLARIKHVAEYDSLYANSNGLFVGEFIMRKNE